MAMTLEERPPRLDLELVREFVIAGHSNLEKVKTMLQTEPRLLNAAHDWGGGDWETALEGAAHVGTRDVALYLLEQGARPSLFASAMLGELEVVKPFLTLYPAMKDAKGAHNIPLLVHAKNGGDHAQKVVEFLGSL
jgi:hypothetical protein